MTWANKVRIGWGLGFLVAAGFNLIYTLQADLKLFWEWFRENAWFTIYGRAHRTLQSFSVGMNGSHSIKEILFLSRSPENRALQYK